MKPSKTKHAKLNKELGENPSTSITPGFFHAKVAGTDTMASASLQSIVCITKENMGKRVFTERACINKKTHRSVH
jgi:hypothetical protein